MDQIEEVLAKTDIVELLGEYISLKRAGRNFKALCPFHSEKTPSFIVSPERQIFKCFGCGIGGNAIKFLMEYEKIDFGEALRFLAKRAGITLRSYRPAPDEEKKQRLYQINHLSSELFHYLLLNHPAGKKALDYLLKRGILKKTIEQFKIGYAPLKYNFLEQFLVKKKGFTSEEVVASGLAFKNDRGQLTDRFRDRVMFPLSNQRGETVGFSGRIITPQANVGKYINTPETLLYHKSQLLFGLDQAKKAIRQEKRALVVEGEFDMISPFQAGIKNIVAIKGSALTEEQIRLLLRFTDEILLALDEDAAGDAASRRGIEMATNAGLNVKVVRLAGRFKDPDEAARADLPFLLKQIKKAMPVFDFYILSATKRFDLKTAWGKKQAADELAPILAKIDDEILRSHYLQLTAKKLGVSQEAMFKKLSSLGRSFSSPSPNLSFKKEKSDRQKDLVDYLFSVCFQYKQEKFLLKKSLAAYFTNPAQKRLRHFLKVYFTKNKKFSSQKFSRLLPPELVEVFNNFYLVPLPKKLVDKEIEDREIQRIIAELKMAHLRQKINHFSHQIALGEQKGKDKEVARLQNQIDKLLQKMKL